MQGMGQHRRGTTQRTRISSSLSWHEGDKRKCQSVNVQIHNLGLKLSLSIKDSRVAHEISIYSHLDITTALPIFASRDEFGSADGSINHDNLC